MLKRVISCVVVVLLVFSLGVSGFASGAPVEEPASPIDYYPFSASGTCGANLTWRLESGTLTISGSGAMSDYRRETAPWGRYEDGIIRIVIESGVTSIGDYAFYECGDAISVTIPNSVTSLGAGAFEDCGDLMEITIPSGVRTIESRTFYGCERITAITIPGNVTSIGASAFEDCEGLRTVTIPASVAQIGRAAFADCERLTTVTIQNPNCTMPTAGGALGLSFMTTVRGYTGSTAETYARQHGYNFESIGSSGTPSTPKPTTAPTPAPGGDALLSGSCGNGVSFVLTENGTLTISGSGKMTDYQFGNAPWCGRQYERRIKTVVVQSGVTGIGSYAFYDLEGLTSVTLPQTVTSLGTGAFYDCDRLQTVNIPRGLLSMGAYVFSGCEQLQSVTIPGGVTQIPDFAFDGCEALKSVTISSGVTSIGISAFEDCQNLPAIDLPASVQTIGDRAFDECERLTSITVRNARCQFPAWSFGAYRATIYGYAGSTAEAFARNNGYAFRSLGTSPGVSDRNGWVTEGGSKFYYEGGIKQKGLRTIDGETYYFSAKDGAMLTGVVNTGNGTLRYFDRNGKMIAGSWITGAAGKKHYADASGVLYTGVRAIGQNHYYFSVKDGHMMKGGLVTGPGGNQYYVSAKDGRVLKDCWAKGPLNKQQPGKRWWYQLDENGVLLQAVSSAQKPDWISG